MSSGGKPLPLQETRTDDRPLGEQSSKKGLENKQVHDTEIAIKVAVEAMKELIKKDLE